MSERTSEHSGARERSEQCGGSKRVSGESNRADERVAQFQRPDFRRATKPSQRRLTFVLSRQLGILNENVNSPSGVFPSTSSKSSSMSIIRSGSSGTTGNMNSSDDHGIGCNEESMRNRLGIEDMGQG